MKSFLLIIAFLVTSTAFAGSVENKIKDIEAEYNARCEYKKKSFGLCLGADYYSSVCYYSVKYNCASNEGQFVAKIKMKSFYHFEKAVRVEKIRKVKIKK
ncbi:MAG: hypothetical protein ACOVP4_12650 [Bacteriovoracaceae bacterium]